MVDAVEDGGASSDAYCDTMILCDVSRTLLRPVYNAGSQTGGKLLHRAPRPSQSAPRYASLTTINGAGHCSALSTFTVTSCPASKRFDPGADNLAEAPRLGM